MLLMTTREIDIAKTVETIEHKVAVQVSCRCCWKAQRLRCVRLFSELCFQSWCVVVMLRIAASL